MKVEITKQIFDGESVKRGGGDLIEAGSVIDVNGTLGWSLIHAGCARPAGENAELTLAAPPADPPKSKTKKTITTRENRELI